MTSLSNRKRSLLRIDDVSVAVETGQGPAVVTGIVLLADDDGLAVVGPEPTSRHVLPWTALRSVACQEPTTLPAGEPATVLEVVLAQGRSLRFMLPVSQVRPSETIVLETQLAALLSQHGDLPATPTDAAPLEAEPMTHMQSASDPSSPGDGATDQTSGSGLSAGPSPSGPASPAGVSVDAPATAVTPGVAVGDGGETVAATAARPAASRPAASSAGPAPSVPVHFVTPQADPTAPPAPAAVTTPGSDGHVAARPTATPSIPVHHVTTPTSDTVVARPEPGHGRRRSTRRRDGKGVSIEAKLMMVMVALLLGLDGFLFVYVTHNKPAPVKSPAPVTVPVSSPQGSGSAGHGSSAAHRG